MPKNIKLIIGSTRQNRISPQVAEWIVSQSKDVDFNLEVLDLKEIALPAFNAGIPPAYGPTEIPAGKAWAQQVASADGFIFLTAEYNRSIPSALKNAIDYLASEWKDKPAVIVGYGYIDGGGSATRHLQDIFKWLKVKTISPIVPLQLTQEDLENGMFKDMAATFSSSASTLQTALKQLQ